MRALFQKESPMLGFSFSLVVSGGQSETRWTGAVEGRWMLSRTKRGGSNATPCLAEERYCASGTVWRGLYDGLGVQNVCNVLYA